MYCSNCGTQCSDKDAFCASCGSKIVSKSEANAQNTMLANLRKTSFVGELIDAILTKGIKQVFCIASLLAIIFFLFNISGNISSWLRLIASFLLVYICVMEKTFFSKETSFSLSAYALSFLVVDIPHIFNRISKKTVAKYSVVTTLMHILIYAVIVLYFYCKNENKTNNSNKTGKLVAASLLSGVFSVIWLFETSYWKNVLLGLGYVIFWGVIVYQIKIMKDTKPVSNDQESKENVPDAVTTDNTINGIADKLVPGKLKEKCPNTSPVLLMGIILIVLVALIGITTKCISSVKNKSKNNYPSSIASNDNDYSKTEYNLDTQTNEAPVQEDENINSSPTCYSKEELNGEINSGFVKKGDELYSTGINKNLGLHSYYYSNGDTRRDVDYSVFMSIGLPEDEYAPKLSRSNGDQLILVSSEKLDDLIWIYKSENYGFCPGLIFSSEINGYFYLDMDSKLTRYKGYGSGNGVTLSPEISYPSELELWRGDNQIRIFNRYGFDYGEALTLGYYEGTQYHSIEKQATHHAYKVYNNEAFTKLPYELTKDGYAILDTSSMENGMYAFTLGGMNIFEIVD